MGCRIGVDVGGTFTDLVALSDDGELHVSKVQSTPGDPAVAVMDAVAHMASQFGLSTPELLAECRLFVHGSTVATNTMLEGKGAKVAMITTEGFRDSLEIRRGARENSWDHRTPFAPVLVPRSLRLGVSARTDRNGDSVVDVDVKQIANCAEHIRKEAVESVAVCLLNSFLNDQHEKLISDLLRQQLNDVFVSSSSDVAPIMGEYERGSTTVVNAYLAPKVVPYLRRLDEQLNTLGLKQNLLLVQSNAGASSVEQVAPRPATLLLSGPAAAVGALTLVAEQTSNDNLISMEIGGTSCDVVMMNAGEVGLREQSLIAGYHVALPSIDIHTVGAGGGTIARIDTGGMLKAGPTGAGAVPGPACYDLGGSAPTVTDALLVLGRLGEGKYADGAVSINRKLAERAVRDELAVPLQITPIDAAVGVVSILEQNLLHAVQRISIERGLDPSPCTLVAAGGAGPMHGTTVARALGCQSVYVPRQAGAFCAMGMLNTDVRHDVMRVLIGDLDTVAPERISAALSALEQEARSMIESEGFGDGDTKVERYISLHYAGQQSSIRIAYHSFDTTRIRVDFEALHQRMFGHIQPGGHLEITMLSVTGVGKIQRITPMLDKRIANSPQPRSHRDVYCNAPHGFLNTAIYHGDDLAPGFSLPGPVLIEELTTTVYVGKDETMTVDSYGNYLIELGTSS